MTTVIDDRLALRVWEVSARERDCVRINIRTPLSGQRGDIRLYVLRLINPALEATCSSLRTGLGEDTHVKCAGGWGLSLSVFLEPNAPHELIETGVKS